MSHENKRALPEAVISLFQFGNYLIISTSLNNYWVEITDVDLFESIEYEEKK